MERGKRKGGEVSIQATNQLILLADHYNEGRKRNSLQHHRNLCKVQQEVEHCCYSRPSVGTGEEYTAQEAEGEGWEEGDKEWDKEWDKEERPSPVEDHSYGVQHQIREEKQPVRVHKDPAQLEGGKTGR